MLLRRSGKIRSTDYSVFKEHKKERCPLHLKGSPEPKNTGNPFTDVKPGDYYYKPVLWAVEQGITGGTSATTFSPGDTCTSGQVLTFLWRANGSPDSVGAETPYYAKAVAWAAEKGLLHNMGSFSASKQSPRGDIVTYLYRNAK